jgi:ribonuclease HII
MLQEFYSTENDYEICIDEVGRGCLFGRTYIACVVLPKSKQFDGKNIKDSKKFSSKKKIKDVSDYIKENALLWHIEYVESNIIDEINILQAVMRGMHECIRNTLLKIKEMETKIPQNGEHKKIMAIVDGNYFNPYMTFDENKQHLIELPSITIEQGDAKYMGIAAASILAKVARDEYIIDLCKEYPVLSNYYGLEKNMGYGTKMHMEGIQKYGITKMHRRTFGICKTIEPNVLLVKEKETNIENV